MPPTIDYKICSVCGVAVPTLEYIIHWNNHFQNTLGKLKKKSVWDTPVGDKWHKKSKR